jgi:SAM-dependent methyltransferase
MELRLRTEKTKDYFESVAHKYLGRSQRGLGKWLRRLEMPIIQQLLGAEFLGDVLELGSGAGYYTHYLKSQGCRSLVCVDFSPSMLEKIDIPECDKVVADIQTYWSEKKFDTIFCAGALEFLDKPSVIFNNAAQMLKPDGSLILLMPRLSLAGLIYQLFHRFHGVTVKLFAWKQVESWTRAAELKVTERRRVSPFSMCLKVKKTAA